MSLAWQKLDIGPEFKGLLRRRQMQVEDPTWFAELKNVDCYGGTLGKRYGTQIVNGYGSYTGHTNTTTIIEVADVTGFVVGTVIVGGFTTDIEVITSTGSPAGTLQLGTPLPTIPGEGVPVVQYFTVGPWYPIQTLFQAIYREQDKRMFAAISNVPYNVRKAAVPDPIPQALPKTTVRASIDPTNLSLLAVPEPNAVVGDEIFIGAPLNFHTRVTHWLFWPDIGFLVDPPMPSYPPIGTEVLLYPQRGLCSSDRPPEMVQYANVTHYTSGPRVEEDPAHPGETPTRYRLKRDTMGRIICNIPLVIDYKENPDPTAPKELRIRRHGIKAGQYTGDNAYAGGPISPISHAPDPPPAPQTQLVSGQNYGWRFRYVNRQTGQESEGSDQIRLTITTGNNAARVTIPTSPDPQVGEIRLYRTTAGGDGAWYRVTTVFNFAPHYKIHPAEQDPTHRYIPNAPSPGFVVVEDITPDDQLGAQMRDLQDICIPDGVSVLAIWGQANRLVGIDPVTNTVVFSDQPDLETGRLKGESWPVNNQIFVSYDDGDKLTGLAAFFDSLIIFKEHSVWRVTGIPPDLTLAPVHFRQDQTAAGATGQRSIVMDHNEVIFRGTDAIYQLNRFESQAEGFKSSRISTAVDDFLQDRIEHDSDEQQVFTHAVYFRFKRQFRCWLTTERMLVFQFEAGADGDSMGWAEWHLANPPTPEPGIGLSCSCVARFDEMIFRGQIDPQMLVSGLDAAVFAATPNGVILQMDVGHADFGCMPYDVWIKSIFFPPGGRGAGARVRALDWQVASINDSSDPTNPDRLPRIRIETDWLRGPGGIMGNTEVHMPIPPMPDALFQPPNTVDVIAAEAYQYRMYSTLFLAPGQYHQFAWREMDRQSMYRISGMTYWFQAMPPATVRRRVLQPTVEPTEVEPTDVVIQG